MTLAELWELFPIVLTAHNPQWSVWAEEEVRLLSSLLVKYHPIISHIGSTAIPDIQAKPIVDILVEVKENLQDIAATLQNCGWVKMSESEHRISLNKGYTEAGFAEKVFHLHLRLIGDNDEIYFRDYLIAHPDVAKKYEALKLKLWEKFEYNRDGYTDAKSKFIVKYTTLAK